MMPLTWKHIKRAGKIHRESVTERHPTSSTMKVILLFALFGLSFYHANGHSHDTPPPKGGSDCPSPPPPKCPTPPPQDCPPPETTPPPPKTCSVERLKYAKEDNCLERALEESAEFLEAFADFLCSYKDCKNGGSHDKYKRAVEEFLHLLECFGCRLDRYLGTGKTVTDILTRITEAAAGVGEDIEKLLSKLGILEPIADALCTLVGDLLKSSCLRDALKKDATGAVDNLKGLFCGDDEKKADKVADAVESLLKNGGCAADKILKTDETLKQLTESLGGALNPVLRTVLKVSEKLPIGGIVCDLLGGSLLKPLFG